MSNLRDIETQEHDILLSVSATMLLKYDNDLTLVSVNECFLDLIGYTKSEFEETFANKAVNLLHESSNLVLLINSAISQINNSTKRELTLNVNLKHKEKGVVPIRAKGRSFRKKGEKHSYVILSIEYFNQNEQLSHEIETMRSFIDNIANLTEDAFFEYDIVRDVAICSQKFVNRFGLPEIITNFSNIIRSGQLICPDSRNHVSSSVLQPSDETVTAKLHMHSKSGETFWYLVHYKIFSDEKGRPVKAIGKLNDISTQQNEINELTKKSETDLLTGLYNKVSSEKLISETLKNRRFVDANHYLMIIDIDNFKEVNDKIGHLYGDAVLIQLSDSLKHIFRSDDIIGRAGGDEFIVLVKSCLDEEIVLSKAREVCSSFRNTFGEGPSLTHISASVGISKSPEHGDSYETLFQNADTALYTVKAQGKNNYSMYTPNMKSVVYNSQRTEIDFGKQDSNSITSMLSKFIFSMLNENKSPENIFPAALKLISDQLDLSKGYIFEVSEDGEYCKKTFSWDNEELFGHNEYLNEFPVCIFPNIYPQLVREGKLIIQDIESLLGNPEVELLFTAGMRSSIIFPIPYSNSMHGLIGFEHCAHSTNYTDKEIDELATLARVVSTFWLNYKLKIQLRDKENSLENK